MIGKKVIRALLFFLFFVLVDPNRFLVCSLEDVCIFLPCPCGYKKRSVRQNGQEPPAAMLELPFSFFFFFISWLCIVVFCKGRLE